MWRSVCVLTVLLGATTAGNIPPLCSLVDMNADEIMEWLEDYLQACTMKHHEHELRNIISPPDEDTSRLNMKGYCNATDRADECFLRLTAHAERCLAWEPLMLLKYKVDLENWKHGVDVVCRDDGERAAMFFYVRAPYRAGITERCGAILRRNRTDNRDISRNTLKSYHKMQAYKTCILDILEANDAPSDDVVSSFMADIIRKMKCVASDNETVQYCETLDKAAKQSDT